MIRFTWVQSRTQTLLAAAALAAVAIALAISGPHLVHLYHDIVATCQAHGDCSTANDAFLRNDATLRTWLGVLVVVLPGVVGIFWGAPLVAREIEAGTYRLAWTQGVTRTRWLAVKLAVIGGVSMAVAGLLSLIVTWWARPLDRAHMSRFATFDQRDLVPIGYAAFAFALGVVIGVVIRRTLPAMVTTLVAFVAARLAVTHWIRPHLIAPAHQIHAMTAASVVGYGSNSPFGGSSLELAPTNIPNAWIYSTRLVDATGHANSAQYVKAACPTLGAGPSGGGGGGAPGAGALFGGSAGQHTQAPASAQEALYQCGVKVAARFHEVVTYQPANRYWTFQCYELAIFVGAALLLAGAGVWWVRRRRW